MRLDLQDGFFNDTVVINIDGKEIFRKTDVKTRFQIGLALSEDLSLPENASNLEITIPLKKISKTIKIHGSEPLFLGVSLTQDAKLECRISDKPFGYV